MAKTMRGSGIFLAQFAGDTAPFNSLPSIAKWAADLGYDGIQIPAWDSLDGVDRYDDLPAEARGLLERIEAFTGVPVVLVSPGPERSQTILRDDHPLADAASSGAQDAP